MKRKDKITPVIFEKEEPADSVEGRDLQMINLAYRRAEEQMRTGTASAQVLCHFMKMGSRREQIEREIMEKQARLVGAKTDAIETAGDSAQMAKRALDAFMGYAPTKDEQI